MRSKTFPDQPNAELTAVPLADAEKTGVEKAAPPAAFKLPFSTAEALAAKKTKQPWHLKGINPGHEKRIGMAPKGTRRSMGKR